MLERKDKNKEMKKEVQRFKDEFSGLSYQELVQEHRQLVESYQGNPKGLIKNLKGIALVELMKKRKGS